jgi:NAD(P)-dependent dehydrogenase (short-subunit alcohol dehydrogenase family)
MKRLASADAKQAIVAAVPVGRMGTVDDIGQTAAFLASPLASYISGCVVVCDGGSNLAGSARFNAGAEKMLQQMSSTEGAKP